MPSTLVSAPRVSARRSFRAALSGHAIEWYEFGVYGVVAAYVASAMFPSDDPALSLLSTWATYSAAFFVRPLGGVVIGRIGDQFGRRRALFLTVSIMSAATFGLGVLPGYEILGLFAPVAFAALRLAQGFAVGAEMPSAMSYITETSPRARHPVLASGLAAATFSASLMGSVLATALALLLGPEAMAAWGWRLLFIAALPLGLMALVLRRGAYQDAPDVATREPQLEPRITPRSPLAVTLRTQRAPMLRYLAIASVYCVGLSVMFGGYSTELLVRGMTSESVLVVTTFTYAVLIASILTFGMLVKRLGTRCTLIMGTSGLGLAVVPAYALAAEGTMSLVLLGGAILATPTGVLATPVYLALADMFPRSVRVTAGAIAFNAATALSSLAPVLALGMRSVLGFDGGAALITVIIATASLLVVAVSPSRAFDRHA